MGKKLKNMTDTNLLLTITIVVFFVMYIGAIVFQGKGFLKQQTFFNILNANAALIIIPCGMRLVLTTRADVGSHLVALCKVGSTKYFDRDCISSGLQQIDDSSQTDIEIQVKWRW